MGTVVTIVVVAALVGAVVWNRRNAQAALAGVAVEVPCQVGQVADALEALYCKGVKAATRNLVAGVKMTRTGASSFGYRTRSGRDTGAVHLTADGGATRLRAATTELYVGAPDKGVPDRGIFALSWNIVNGTYRLLGVTPGAAPMKRFQARLPTRLERYLVKQGLAAAVPRQRDAAPVSIRTDGRPLRTSFGYEAPADAVLAGTWCVDCGARESELPARWPAACGQCGRMLDPVFAQPWQHDAEGFELRQKVAQDPQDSFSVQLLHVWQHADALRSGGPAAVAAARTAAREHEREMRSADPDFQPGYLWHYFVWNGLEARDLDGAADDLLHWLGSADTSDLEEHNGRRTNCRQAVASALRFLDPAAGAGHARADEVRRRCLEVATGAYSVLDVPSQRAVTALARTA